MGASVKCQTSDQVGCVPGPSRHSAVEHAACFGSGWNCVTAPAAVSCAAWIAGVRLSANENKCKIVSTR